MSLFYCAECDSLSDADDGCDEASPGGLDLICIDCMEAREDDASEPQPQDQQSAGDKSREAP